MSFPERLLEALKLADVKRHGAGVWLAKQTGTTVKAANKWLNGESQPRREKVLQIASATGVRPEWLEYGTGEIISDEVRENTSTYNLHTADAWDSDTPLEPHEVEVPFFSEVELAAGNGFSNVQEISTHKLRFNLSTLHKAGVSTDTVACCKVTGDSMEPVLPGGSTVGIDTSQVKIQDGKMYAIEHGGLLRVKYLYRLPFNGIRIISANPDVQDEELSGESAQDVRIIGRVFWYSVLL
ncbi:S24 family peptidase [Marinomonas aquiplantarum]|uniref:Phage repressor protein C with HTH and peptisase S24 domain n=1 Tax=Marinomonas aquiplantarum TaxID=491951 RepID=A0A366D007_9GAMM|nr:helix-turn-helix transcriptional regulator [Marinomonas aquiplantarum]RBO83403.1 phage repressor protein C with HTH and peptisase S24 domain [Marinomonas aquiplantarum]